MDDVTVLTESFVDDFDFWKGVVDKINETMVSNNQASGLSAEDVKKFTYNEFCQEYLRGAQSYIRKYGKLTQDNANTILSSMITKRLKITFRDYQYKNSITEAIKVVD